MPINDHLPHDSCLPLPPILSLSYVCVFLICSSFSYSPPPLRIALFHQVPACLCLFRFLFAIVVIGAPYSNTLQVKSGRQEQSQPH